MITPSLTVSVNAGEDEPNDDKDVYNDKEFIVLSYY